MQRRILFNVQLLRFLAASAILFTHTASVVAPNSAALAHVPWVGGVDLFFVISGFIMTFMTRGQFGSGAASRRFLVRRLIRIVPPYWFFNLVTVALLVAAGGRIDNTTANPVTVVTSLAFVPWPRVDGQLVPIIAQGWTLNYEMFFYLAFAACILVPWGRRLLVGAFVALAMVHAIIPEGWFVARFYSDPVILEFVAGIGLGLLYLSGKRLGLLGAAGAIGAAVLVYVLVPLPGHGLDRLVHLGIPAALIGAALILGREPARQGPLLSAVKAGGDASYTLYLSHKLVVGAVLVVCAGAGVRQPFVVIATAMVAAIAFALLFYRLVETRVVTSLGTRFTGDVSRGLPSVAP
ncbi:exopolysaccharide production protein ExoZ [Sphingomonas sp. F9_3S_D5_B_2]